MPLGIFSDFFRTLRILWRHSVWLVAVEDVFFLLGWAMCLVCFSTAFARGELRFYYAFGSGLGTLLYRCTIGCVTVPLLHRIFSIVAGIFYRISHRLFHCIVRIFRNLKGKFGHFAKLFEKAFFFSNLPLIGRQKMLYNTNRTDQKQEAARKWQKQSRRGRNSPVGFSDSSAGRQL
jgi:hypothetical protein